MWVWGNRLIGHCQWLCRECQPLGRTGTGGETVLSLLVSMYDMHCFLLAAHFGWWFVHGLSWLRLGHTTVLFACFWSLSWSLFHCVWQYNLCCWKQPCSLLCIICLQKIMSGSLGWGWWILCMLLWGWEVSLVCSCEMACNVDPSGMVTSIFMWFVALEQVGASSVRYVSVVP